MIVVGVDGTRASHAALDFAVREGARRGSVIEVVTAWAWAGPSLTGVPLLRRHEDGRPTAQAIQDAAIAHVLEQVRHSPVLSRRVVQGDAVQELVHAASIAEYLVVGSARRKTLRRAMLGSVSEACVRLAGCPVVVVPHPSHRSLLDQAS